jgi:radical SAM protein with 4Fe4S-binding SPASM domain|tara:strand:- start:1324 stop:2433 length:1110 start_codon:yes stop_codon:yes gene_type:complete
MNLNKIKISDYGFDTLQIESTAACNMACSFCPYPLKEDKTSKIELNDIYSLLDSIDFSDKKFKYVTFSQFNEPLLDKRIFDILKYCKEKDIPVLFITNGLLLNKQHNIDNLLKFGTNIKISLQVLDSNKHKNARGLNLELERYLKTVTNFCLMAKNKKDINITIDLGCNFNDRKVNYYLKKILGIQVGDPSVPKNLTETMKIFSNYADFFYDISDENYKTALNELKTPKKYFKLEYLKQEGYKIFSNISLKIKPFLYGRRISEFYPINNNFACDSKILAVLADGNVVPCCLTYDDTISMGKLKENSLREILEKSNRFLNNLRTNNSEKNDICKKCFGEPTKRGALIRNAWNFLPNNIKKIFYALKVTSS